MEDDRTRHVAFFLLLTVPLTDVKFWSERSACDQWSKLRYINLGKLIFSFLLVPAITNIPEGVVVGF